VATHYLETKKHALALSGARLLVLRGPDRGRAYRIAQEVVCVGTAPSCDLVLSDPTVSAHHLSIRILRDSYLVTDLESTNGVLAGGYRVAAVYLQVGDTLDLGQTRIRLEALPESTKLQISDSVQFGRLIGRSAGARRLFALLEAVARQDSTVLLVGETGTGKDLAAQAVHEASARAEKPFVVVDCSAIPATLIESELFGHERGAFTGADRRREGAFLEADGGTVFFDEIAKLPYDMQPKLLRALENREVRPLGAGKPIAFDVRVIAASDRDLRVAVNRGQFREDLFYRLNVVNVRVPPLRERPEDVPLLANHFYRELTRDDHAVLPIDTMNAFLSHDWPGNIRELRNAVEQSLVLADVAHLTEDQTFGDDPGIASYRVARARALNGFERQYLWSLMTRAQGNVSQAARLGNMDRVNLTKLLRKHGIVSQVVARQTAAARP
jgi:transcriptional regulator with GAF, ATPase, and Fis domain